MRTLSLALAGAVALASASAAQATIMPVYPTTDVNVTDVYNGAASAYITYQKPSGQTGDFSDTLAFTNDVAGVFNLHTTVQALAKIGSIVNFTTLTLTGPFSQNPLNLLQSQYTTTLNGTTTYSADNVNLGVGTYFLILGGNAPAGTTFQGQINFSLANGVPEPATWGLMLLGFGLMGSSMRRRRARIAVAQLA